MAITLIIVFIILIGMVFYAVRADIRLTKEHHLLVASGAALKRRKDDPLHPMRRSNDGN